MAAGVQITDRDNGFDRLMTNVRNWGQDNVIRVGVTDAPHVGTPGMSVADIGKIHEFGLGHAPQRSFLRGWVDANQRTWTDRLKQSLRAFFFRGVRWQEGFGEYCVQGVQDRIRQHIPPPLEDKTVRRKRGNSVPLVDTEQLINGIIYDTKAR